MPELIARLQSEIEDLKRRLSAARRAVPPESIRDYTFRTGEGRPVTLRELFGGKSDLLVVHNMGRKCPYCTMWADGFNGLASHLSDRAAFALASPDEPSVMREFAASRGWKFTMISTADSNFTADLGYEPEPGRYWPGVSAFRMLTDGHIERTGRATFGPGDDFCAAWPMFDLLDGGAKGWAPKFSY